jgi:hypothetical protein
MSATPDQPKRPHDNEEEINLKAESEQEPSSVTLSILGSRYL